ncbi:hypothetical protein BSL78_17998 [Apostichopus japonicus]|uniref:Serine aminopeptidase S33 domain-containing protein n=1 Tax=Stichopus japonicus TaxID=307972 RepID=A0A2G8KAU9_STIJA|nr:hypothetical protein BSL78_17998 [Apostichopus japonicus]
MKGETSQPLPLFVVSHSMGGLINIMMANERPKEFINLLISPCLGFNPKDATPLKISGAKLLSWCWYHKQLPKISSSLISRDPAVAKDYDEDPLVFHGGPKVGFVVKMHNCIQAVLQAASSVEWPYFLLHGDADQICDVGGSRTFHNSAKSKDKTLKVYEGYYHELDKEPEEYAKVILDDMREWLSSRLNGTETGDGKPEADESDVKVEEQNAQEE